MTAAATLLFPAPSAAEILSRRPSRRAGRIGPHYPARTNPIVRLPGVPDWRDFGLINSWPVEFAAQADAPPVSDQGAWRWHPSGIWVGLRMT